ncbi:MAG: hypothetical protein LQ351_000539 [Letrouitia transgressa]|nr:MAG: hypothetical protein LQ351_000539 [Letrouitia transgressa]
MSSLLSSALSGGKTLLSSISWPTTAQETALVAAGCLAVFVFWPRSSGEHARLPPAAASHIVVPRSPSASLVGGTTVKDRAVGSFRPALARGNRPRAPKRVKFDMSKNESAEVPRWKKMYRTVHFHKGENGPNDPVDLVVILTARERKQPIGHLYPHFPRTKWAGDVSESARSHRRRHVVRDRPLMRMMFAGLLAGLTGWFLCRVCIPRAGGADERFL